MYSYSCKLVIMVKTWITKATQLTRFHSSKQILKEHNIKQIYTKYMRYTNFTRSSSRRRGQLFFHSVSRLKRVAKEEGKMFKFEDSFFQMQWLRLPHISSTLTELLSVQLQLMSTLGSQHLSISLLQRFSKLISLTLVSPFSIHKTCSRSS